MKDLLIDHCNPVLKARYFGVIFDEVPTYEEIKCGTLNIEKIPGVNELFKLAHSQEVSLVHSIDLSWNQIESSLLLMYEKLIELGFVYSNRKVELVEPEMEDRYETHPEKA